MKALIYTLVFCFLAAVGAPLAALPSQPASLPVPSEEVFLLSLESPAPQVQGTSPEPIALAACPATYCAQARAECLQGCPCAIFTCNPVQCTSNCTCPIICLD
jgi:hypothetical protein